MPKATVKAKSGALITIEGTEQEVSKIISIIEGTSQASGHSDSTVQIVASKRAQKRRLAATDLVMELKEEGFLNKPKTLGEVSSALQEKGYLRPITTLSGVMLGLVKKRIITRKKTGGRWVYGR